jgi:hypothetical protein
VRLSPFTRAAAHLGSPPLHLHLYHDYHHLPGPLLQPRRLRLNLDRIRQRLQRLARRHLLPDLALYAPVHALRPRRHPPPRRRVSAARTHRPKSSPHNRRHRVCDCVSLRYWRDLQLWRCTGVPQYGDRVSISLHAGRACVIKKEVCSFPIYFIMESAARSPAAATVFMAALFVVSCVALTAVHQTASRLTWSFARDEALFFSSRLSKIHPSLGVPVLALILNGILVLLVGIVYIISTTGALLPSFCLCIYTPVQKLTKASLQRLHQHNSHRRADLLRRPGLHPPVSPSAGAFPASGQKVQAPRCPGVYCERGHGGLGGDSTGVFLLSEAVSGYGWEYEYANPSLLSVFGLMG